MQSWDLIVIGGGPAGQSAAMEAVGLGARVAIIEQRGAYGGTCRYAGCVPSKALLHTAEVLHNMRHHAGAVGLPTVDPQWDFQAVVRHKDDVIRRVGGDDGYNMPASFHAAGGETWTGTARFLDTHTLQVGTSVLRGDRFIIATGSHPRVPPIPGLAEAGYLTWEGIFDLPAVPPALAIIGGGPLGIELSQAFRRFGSAVTVWEAEERIIPQADPDAVNVLQTILEAEGVQFRVGAKITAVRRSGSELAVVAEQQGRTEETPASHILVAVGQEPNSATLDLDLAHVRCARDGRIEVDDQLRTSAAHIFACGDVTGGYQLAHVAEYEGKLAAANAVKQAGRCRDERVVPWAIFTSPPLAHVGLLESEARDRHLPIVVAQQPVTTIERALLVGLPEGCVKAIAHGETGELLGVEIVCAGADDLIHEAALAIKLRASVHDIAELIHAFPTFSQGLSQIAGELAARLKAQ